MKGFHKYYKDFINIQKGDVNVENAPPSTFWDVPLHDWGRHLMVWAENPTSRINFSRRMQCEWSGMPPRAMLRDRWFVILGLGILENVRKMPRKCPGKNRKK